MSEPKAPAGKPVLNVDEAKEHEALDGEHWGGYYKVMTPLMESKPGSLGANVTRVPPGRSGCPFHHHMLEDEIFFVLSGTGTLRYGDDLHPLRAGDCISCPAGTGVAFQIANTGDEDLVYFGVGRNDPHEVCVYPDSGKVMVRYVKTVGFLKETSYMEGEAARPRIFDMVDEQG